MDERFSGTIPALVSARARLEPDAVAVTGPDGSLTRRALDRRADLLARRLVRLGGVGPEARVGVFLSRTTHLVSALLGVLRAGGAYVPLDPGYPAARLDTIVRDAGLRAVLTEEALVERLPSGVAGLRPLLVERLLEGEDDAGPDGSPELERPPAPDNLAYVIYTSGSTGTPKGVAIAHRSAVALLDWARRAISPAERRGLLAATSVCFDLSVFEIFLPLVAGGRIVLAADALELPRLAEAGVTLVNTVPSVMAELLRQGPLPASVSTVALAGEPLPRSLADALYRLPGVRRVLDLYGPSEDTTYSTWSEVPRRSEEPPSIGVPLPGTSARVVDPDGGLGAAPRYAPEAAGATGELYLGGDGLARGYLGRPALTAERFLPDPWSPVAGGRLYRTGDRVRRRPDGGLDFLGRLDHQVKLRGFRIELGEVEVALDRHPGLDGVAVVVRADASGEPALVAYGAVADPEAAPSARDLRDFLAERLPAYMVPQRFVLLDLLPRTPTGKIDRKALPDPDAAGSARPPRPGEPGAQPGAGPGGQTPGGRPPRGPMEEVLAALWEQVLGVAEVSAEDRFLDLGGHSLLASQVAMRLRERAGVELPQHLLLGDLDLAAVARALEASRGPAPEEVAFPAGPADGAPLSSAQERLWLAERRFPGTARFNVPILFSLDGPLDPAALAAGLDRIERRHEPLRTVIEVGEPAAVQRVPPPRGLPLPVVDLSGLARLPDERLRNEAARAVRRLAERPLDLERGPLARALLVRLGPVRHRLLVVIHHAATDDRSTEVLVAELGALYRAALAGRPLDGALPALPVRYADYARWEQRCLEGGRGRDLAAHWRARLDGASDTLDLPADRPRPAEPSHRGGWLPVVAAPPLAAELRRFARSSRASGFSVLLAALAALASRATGQSDLVIAAPMAGRLRAELEPLIGIFVNSLPLRLRLDGEPSFRELVERAREAVLDGLLHQELPFGRLIEELERGPGSSAEPFRRLVLAHRVDPGTDELAPGLAVELEELSNGCAKNDLTLYATERPDGLALTAEYAADLFDRTTVARFLDHLQVLLAGAFAAPETPLAALPVLSAAERHQLLVEADDTPRPQPAGGPGAWGAPATLWELVAAQAARTPERVAVAAGERQVSYGALARAARTIAARLRALGAGPEARVALCLERSPELMAGLLGIQAAGAAYVPLDPSYPVDRLAMMLRSSGARLMVTGRAPAEVLAAVGPADPTGSGGPVRVEVGPEIWRAPEPPEPPASRPAVDSVDGLAYVIFTSGSTGVPKGVMIGHRAIWHRLAWQQRVFPLDETSRVLQKTPLAFDPSLWELFLPLAAGARLELAAPDGHRDTAGLLATVERRGITDLQLVPSQLALFVELVEAGPGSGQTPGRRRAAASLRRLFCGGEALSSALAHRCLDALGVPLYNFYGPAEAAVDVTYGAVLPGDAGATAPIGHTLDAVRAYVVDRALEPVPTGQPGELLVGGAHLGRGYLDAPGATAERFVPDPFGAPEEDPAGGRFDRLYKTGDLVRRLADGRIEFLGRIDHQVKVRGQRIELGEVEAALAALPGVARAAAAVRGDGAARRLVAYLVPEGDVPELPAPAAELRELLARTLPEAMIPAAFVPLAALPTTPSGKVDRGALPEPPAAGGATAHEPPRTSLERRIAALWIDLLGVEQVGREDDFFLLGGHSLLGTRMLFRLQRELAAEGLAELPLAVLFAGRTVAGLARRIEPLLSTIPPTPDDAPGGPVATGSIARRQRRLATVRLGEDGEALIVDTVSGE